MRKAFLAALALLALLGGETKAFAEPLTEAQGLRARKSEWCRTQAPLLEKDTLEAWGLKSKPRGQIWYNFRDAHCYFSISATGAKEACTIMMIMDVDRTKVVLLHREGCGLPNKYTVEDREVTDMEVLKRVIELRSETVEIER